MRAVYHRLVIFGPMASTLQIPIHDSFDPAASRLAAVPECDVSDDAKWALIERILQSKSFRKAQRPSDFLLYICRKALSGQTSELSEQDIGENVFTRKEGFDPGLDNIVRVTARRVRQKLEEFYAVEGHAESMILSVPVGGYVPRFEQRHPVVFDPVIEPEAVTSPEPLARMVASLAVAEERRIVEAKPNGVPLIWIVAVAAAIAATLGGVNAWRYRVHEAELDLPANAMWSTLFAPSRRSIFVPGDSALVLFENHTHHPVALGDYISKRYLAEIPAGSRYPADVEREEAERPYNSVVDVRFAAEIARLPEASKPVDIVLPRDLSLEDLKESDVILSGAREANPWVQMFQDSLDFSIVDRQQGNNYTVVNRHPAAGEPQMYSYNGDDPAHVAYAIVAYMPNLSGQGRVLLLQGTTMAGTEAAMDFVLDPDGLNQFLASHTQHRQVQPFQVLLETTNINGSSPKSRILSYRFH
jgi:hypothetical protein